MTRLKNIRFDPETDDENDLMRQNVIHRKEMEQALVKGQVEKAAEAWDKSEKLVDRLEQVRARKGQMANKRGENGPLHKQDTEIGHLTKGEIVVPLSAQSPKVMRALQETMGRDLSRYRVGSGTEQRNPESGLPAYVDTLPQSGNPASRMLDVVADNLPKGVQDWVGENKVPPLQRLTDKQLSDLYEQLFEQQMSSGPLIPQTLTKKLLGGPVATILGFGNMVLDDIEFWQVEAEMKRRGLPVKSTFSKSH